MYSFESLLFCYILQYTLSWSNKYFQKSVTKDYVTILYPPKPAHRLMQFLGKISPNNRLMYLWILNVKWNFRSNINPHLYFISGTLPYATLWRPRPSAQSAEPRGLSPDCGLSEFATACHGFSSPKRGLTITQGALSLRSADLSCPVTSMFPFTWRIWSYFT